VCTAANNWVSLKELKTKHFRKDLGFVFSLDVYCQREYFWEIRFRHRRQILCFERSRRPLFKLKSWKEKRSWRNGKKKPKKKKNSIIFVQDKGQTFSHSVQFLGAVELWLLALFPAPLNREMAWRPALILHKSECSLGPSPCPLKNMYYMLANVHHLTKVKPDSDSVERFMRTQRTSSEVLKMVYPTLEILDEVQQSNLVDLLEDCCDLEKHCTTFIRDLEEPWNSLINTVKLHFLTVSNWQDSSIGPSVLLLVICNRFPVPLSVRKLKWLNLGCKKYFFQGHILSIVVNARASLVDGALVGVAGSFWPVKCLGTHGNAAA